MSGFDFALSFDFSDVERKNGLLSRVISFIDGNNNYPLFPETIHEPILKQHFTKQELDLIYSFIYQERIRRANEKFIMGYKTDSFLTEYIVYYFHFYNIIYYYLIKYRY